jgi:predicted nuclease with TOPRIM domain
LKDALGNGDTELGARRMLEMRLELDELVAERDSCIYDAHRTASLNAALEKEVDRLEREVASLQQEREKRAEGFITARRRRYIEIMKGYRERLMQERNKAIATTETFGNASGDLREKAGFLVQEKVRLLEELGNPVKRANPWQRFHRDRNF